MLLVHVGGPAPGGDVSFEWGAGAGGGRVELDSEGEEAEDVSILEFGTLCWG